MGNKYITKTKLSIEEFREKFTKANIEIELMDHKLRGKHKFYVKGEDGKTYGLKTTSLRYKLFYNNIRCVTCGIEGKYFLIQKSRYDKHETYHANLYGINIHGDEVMLTKDHIIRKKEGGKDIIENMQTMCWVCNCIIKN